MELRWRSVLVQCLRPVARTLLRRPCYQYLTRCSRKVKSDCKIFDLVTRAVPASDLRSLLKIFYSDFVGRRGPGRRNNRCYRYDPYNL